jgi:hypothetical protein
VGVVTIEPLLAAVGQSLEQARRRSSARSSPAPSSASSSRLEPEAPSTAPSDCPRRPATCALLALVRLELEAQPPRGPVVAFTCLLQPDRPRRGQLTLFGAPEIHPDRLAATLARLTARRGPDRVGSPRTVDGHRPERADSVPFDPPPPPKLRQPPRRGRGLLVVRVLRPPVPLEVIMEEVESYTFQVESSPTRPGGDTKTQGQTSTRREAVATVERGVQER